MRSPLHPVFLLLATMFAAAAAEEKATTPTNLLFILIDHQRNDTLGCAGHPHIRTPHIDRLAAQGVRFSNAFVNTPDGYEERYRRPEIDRLKAGAMAKEKQRQ
jgi:hypothetical protein